ncbi:VCBS repeat-containing protein [Blastococcus sp. CT_GayMR19]|uniref:FG-GAP repeat domain-containing protein n=1 Tax=Blastococcus sp. CT_GayMR19 TaxID=2559608 RepID=UPI0014303286|nr:VCBS repeat-containing protein [Blastococcus sp. CT_GayMR19]
MFTKRSLVRSSVTVFAAGLLMLTAGTAGAAGLLVPAVSMTTAPDALAAYRGQTTCDPVVKPGLRALRDMVMGYYGVGRDGGITRACNISARSEHQEGRAWDWMLDANNPGQRAVGDDFTLWLTGTDGRGEAAGNARRLGVMYVIWNRRIWSASDAASGWLPYSGVSPHTDHVHVSLSWDGAYQRTSWWTGVAVAQQDVGPCMVYIGEFAPAYSGPRYTPCPPAVPRPVNRGTSASRDLDGDGRADTIGRQQGTGTLWFYPGNGAGGVVSRRVVGSGWQMHDSMVLSPDLTGDGRPDLWARDLGTGGLWVYPGDGTGSFTAATQVGWGWHMHDALMAAGDVTGDGLPDLWARERATGYLWLYPGSAGGVPTAPRWVGSGWQMHDALIAPGDVNGDGFADLWAREASTGVLWFYSGDGAGGFRTANSVGYGWGMHDTLIPTVDQTGDGRPDLFGRQRSTGDRYLYPTTATGTPTSPRFGGSGWQMHDTLL